MLKRFAAGITSIALLVCTISAQAAAPGYLKIKGAKSGEVKGSVTQKGHENAISILAASHEVVSPRDAATGQASGKRQHKAFVITKEVDRSSPILYNILVGNEALPTVTLQFVRSGGAGREVGPADDVFYTVTLTNAHISQIRFNQPDTNKAENRALPQTEEISFTYQKISWTFTAGGITAGDDWTLTS